MLCFVTFKFNVSRMQRVRVTVSMSDIVDRDEDREQSPLHERDSLGMFETVAAGESRDKFRTRVRKSGISGLSKGPLVSVVYFARDKTASM